MIVLCESIKFVSEVCDFDSVTNGRTNERRNDLMADLADKRNRGEEAWGRTAITK